MKSYRGFYQFNHWYAVKHMTLEQKRKARQKSKAIALGIDTPRVKQSGSINTVMRNINGRY